MKLRAFVPPRKLALKATVFTTGAVVLLVELLGSRILAPFYGTTIFVWTALITVALAFLAAGYWFGGVKATTDKTVSWLYSSIVLAGLWLVLIPKLQQPLLNFSDHLGQKFGPLAGSLLLFAITFFLLGQVSPLIVGQLSKNAKNNGKVSGEIFGLGTVGSLAGALISVFILLPYLSIGWIFSGAGILLVVVGLAGLKVNYTKKLLILLLLVLVLWLPSFHSGPAALSQIVTEKQSYYSDIKITKNGNLNCLIVNSTTQTCVADPEKKVDALYANQIESLINANQPKRILILGFGGGGLMTIIPSASTVDTVELDPQTVSLSKQAGIIPSQPNHIYYDDARHFLKDPPEKTYDLVIVDVFKGQDLPPYMFSQEAFRLLGRLVNKNGAIFINLSATPEANTYDLVSSVYITLNSVFGDRVKGISSYPNNVSNLNFLVSDANIKLGDGVYAQSANNFNIGRQLVVKDGYNPLEFSAAALEESNHQAVKQADPGILFVK
jgi:spermidine synthase